MNCLRFLILFVWMIGVAPLFSERASAQNFRALEYFWGKDAGVGKGNQVTLTGSSLDSQISIDPSHLLPGINYLYIRMLSDSNLWTPYSLFIVQVEDSLSTGGIANAETFYNKDPGVDRGFSFSFSGPKTEIDTILEWPADTNTGLVYNSFRFRGSNRMWTPFSTVPLMIYGDSLPLKIEELKYFTGRDPGPGKGSSLSIPAAAKMDTIIEITATDSGLNYLHLRMKGNAHFWSTYERNLISYIEPQPLSVLSAWEWALDSISRFLPPNRAPIDSPAFTVDDTLNIRLDGRTGIGRHHVWMRAEDSLKRASVWLSDSFRVINCPMLDTGTFSIQGGFCIGDTLLLHEQITPFGIWPSDSFHFSWFVNASSVAASQNDTLLWPLNQTGSLSITLRYQKKNDSLCSDRITRNMTVFPVFNDTLDTAICSGDSIRIFGVFRKQTDTFIHRASSEQGCDSITVVRLQVYPVYSDTLVRRICQGDSSSIHGVFRKGSGDYLFTGLTGKGCDSFSVIRLIVDSNYEFRRSFLLCSGDTLRMHGKSYTNSGTFTDSFKSQFGCDSVYVSTIGILPTYSDSSSLTICSGDSARIHGIFRYSSGVYTLTTKSKDQCDSTSVISLQVNPAFLLSFRDTLCSGDSIRLHGKFQNQSGIFDSLYRTTRGCDSFVRHILTVNPRYSIQDAFSFCDGDSVKVHNRVFKSSGNFRTSFKSLLACDSIYDTEITVHPVYANNLFVGLCGGDSLLFDGVFRNRTGVYPGLFKTLKGCDSMVSLHLTVDSIIQMFPSFEICKGDSLFLGGQFRKENGIYVDRFTATKGCDSIVSSRLTVNRDTFYVLNDTLCFGEVYSFNGVQHTQSGTHEARLKTIKGCDSIIVLNLHVYPLNTAQQSFSLCSGDSVKVVERFLKVAGNYVDTLIGQNGCDSILTTRIDVLRKDEISITDTLCAKDSVIIGGQIIRRSGLYTEALTNQLGCDSITEYRLFFRPRLDVRIQTVGFDEISTTRPFVTYQWYLDRVLLPGETGSTITVNRGGVYDVDVTDSLGCAGSSMDDPLSLPPNQLFPLPVLYPNPGNGLFTLINNSGETFQCRITDGTGVKILDAECLPGKQLLDLSEHASGVYFITFNTSAGRLTRKIFLIR